MTGNDRVGVVLQERDRHLLRELGAMRIIDRVQAKTVAGFGSDSRANRRLRKLTQAGLLRRFSLGTTAAGQKALYSLSKKGSLVVDVPYRGLHRRKDEALVADFFVEHQLTVNEFYCTVKYGPMAAAGSAFQEWRSFYQPLAPGSHLIPDGYFALHTPAETLAAFLEVDLGHERGPVWREKVRNYLQFAVSGEFEPEFGKKRFRVLVVTTTERRLESLRTTIAATTDRIFWITTLAAVRSQGLFAPIWLRPKGVDRQALLKDTILKS